MFTLLGTIFFKGPDLVLTITDTGEESGQFTVSVRSRLELLPIPTFSEVPTGTRRMHVFTRALGKGSVAEIKEILEMWVRRRAAYVPTFELVKGIKVRVLDVADISVIRAREI